MIWLWSYRRICLLIFSVFKTNACVVSSFILSSSVSGIRLHKHVERMWTECGNYDNKQRTNGRHTERDTAIERNAWKIMSHPHVVCAFNCTYALAVNDCSSNNIECLSWPPHRWIDEYERSSALLMRTTTFLSTKLTQIDSIEIRLIAIALGCFTKFNDGEFRFRAICSACEL